MNNSQYALNDPDKLTVAEYARRFNVSENTVRTRINRKKLKTIKESVDGRETIKILVEQGMDHSMDDSEPFEIVQGTVHNDSREQSEQSNELLGFMRETFQTVQGYTSQIIELSRENERYKLLTDTSSRMTTNLEKELEQLKAEIFQRDARIRELEQSTPNIELSAKVQQLEAEIQKLKEENRLLKEKKGIFSWLGR